MKVFVIIVTYNGMKWIDWCLTSLRQSTVPVIPIVIDNGSTDGLRDYVPTHYPEVVWLPQEQNLGFGQGNNLGMRYALDNEADYVLLLNQDAALQPDALEHMLSVADGRNLVTPVHLCGDGSRIDFMFRESLKRADNQLFDDLLVDEATKPSYEVGEVCAACWLMPIKILKEVGGFCPLFFQYGEDNNYYTRLTYHGIKVILAPKARMQHDRKIHGNTGLYTKKYVHLQLLVALCNPSATLAKRIKKCGGVFIKHPGRFCVEAIRLIPMLPKIAKARSEGRKVKSAWL